MHRRRIAVLSALLAVLTAALLRGRVHPDEIFQFLEPANHLAFGPWMRAWEWEQGLRNWFVPGLLGGALKLAGLAGLRHPWALAALVWTLCATAQAFGTAALYTLVKERDDDGPALLASLVHATWGAWLLYAARPLGDSLSVAALLPALMYAQRKRAFLSGALLGVAVIVRYPSVVFALPLAWCLRRELPAFLAGLAAALLPLGALDWLTWGAPFASAYRYFAFNWSHSDQFGVRPFWWYLPNLAAMAPLLLAYHFLRGLARRDLLVGAFATCALVLLATPHKEARFLVPLLPLWTAIAAAPAWRDLARLPRALLAAAYVATSLAAATIQRPLGLHADVIDATVAMGREPALRSAVILGLPEWNTGGRFYFGSAKPLWVGAEHLDEASHALVTQGMPFDSKGWVSVRKWDEVEVWKRLAATAVDHQLNDGVRHALRDR